jgi:primosomal protein N' (replication factor Y)
VTGFEEGAGDILLGTQMVSKGHDFPNVSLVGIISADTSIHFPDFRAGERTFQLLTQAAGRAGRRDRQGEVIIQTFEPDHPILQMAAQQDYHAFYNREIEQRKVLNYPPWGRLILIRFSGNPSVRVEKAADKFRALLPAKPPFDILGPAPAPLSRIRGEYRFHILLKAAKTADPSSSRMRRSLRATLNRYSRIKQNAAVRVQVDVDPADIM